MVLGGQGYRGNITKALVIKCVTIRGGGGELSKIA